MIQFGIVKHCNLTRKAATLLLLIGTNKSQQHRHIPTATMIKNLAGDHICTKKIHQYRSSHSGGEELRTNAHPNFIYKDIGQEEFDRLPEAVDDARSKQHSFRRLVRSASNMSTSSSLKSILAASQMVLEPLIIFINSSVQLSKELKI